MSQSSVTFEVWNEEFKKHFNSVHAFMEAFETCDNPLKGELKEDLDEELYDSYGNEDSILKRIFYFPEWDIYIMFSGKRQSYDGEQWTEMKEVKPAMKTIQIWES